MKVIELVVQKVKFVHVKYCACFQWFGCLYYILNIAHNASDEVNIVNDNATDVSIRRKIFHVGVRDVDNIKSRNSTFLALRVT